MKKLLVGIMLALLVMAVLVVADKGGKPSDKSGNNSVNETSGNQTSESLSEQATKLTGKMKAAFNGLNKGKSSTKHLYLFQKNSTTWDVIESRTWGKMTFSTKTDKFVFNGYRLNASQNYSLIYYPDPWPGAGCLVLGEGKANKGGSVHIKGAFDFGSVPIAGDANLGAKIWLVLKSDVSCPAGMAAWNPDSYLFEYDLINKIAAP